MSRYMIAAYTQNLGITLFELSIIFSKRGRLISSTTCKIQNMKGQDYILLAFELAQSDIAITN